MIYAPVLIPTLNRYEHLRKCLESLSRCTWADQTEVYVALDYPPSEKYVEGWKKNREFLHSCGDMGFKKLHLIERDHNYGIWTSELSNLKKLVIDVGADLYITSEDDNVFAPAFLDYMNKAIELFKEDNSVLGICGYRHFYPVLFNNNTFFRQCNDCSAWGYLKFPDRLQHNLDYKYFRKKISLKNFYKLRACGRYRLATFIQCCKKTQKLALTDNVLSVLAIINNMDFIMPKVSLVKNIGIDGSGINFSTGDSELQHLIENQELYSEKTFKFLGSGYEQYHKNKKIYRNNSYGEISCPKLLYVICKTIAHRVIYG